MAWLRFPLRVRLGTLLDVLLVDDPVHIHWLNAHPDVDRVIDPRATWLHRLVDARLHTDIGFADGVLPVFRPRSDRERARRQQELFERLERLRGKAGPARDELAACVSGRSGGEEIGVAAQHWCGRLFFAAYRSGRETYRAGRLIGTWPSAPPWRAILLRATGALDRAKRLVSEASRGDLHCIHATSIGMENVARSIRAMRRALERGEALTRDEVVRACLAAPQAVLRGVTARVEAPFLDAPLTPRTLVVFLVARAFEKSGDPDVAFLAEDWSACPARHVIPDMMRAVWPMRRARKPGSAARAS
jgi:hypothetical protein